MNERICRISDFLYWKLRRPQIKTKGFHFIGPKTEINLINGGILNIGKNVRTQKRVVLSVIRGEMSIGENTSFNRNCIVVCHREIQIGENCLFGPNVVIYDHDHKFGATGIIADEFNLLPIIIERNCWIGANAIILKGTHIGESSVIGAGSIVKGEIPPHSLVRTNRELIVTPIEEKS